MRVLGILVNDLAGFDMLCLGVFVWSSCLESGWGR